MPRTVTVSPVSSANSRRMASARGLPQLHQTAGQTPGTQGRLLAPAHQQHRVILKNHSANTHQGLIGIMTFDGLLLVRIFVGGRPGTSSLPSPHIPLQPEGRGQLLSSPNMMPMSSLIRDWGWGFGGGGKGHRPLAPSPKYSHFYSQRSLHPDGRGAAHRADVFALAATGAAILVHHGQLNFHPLPPDIDEFLLGKQDGLGGDGAMLLTHQAIGRLRCKGCTGSGR